MKKSSLWFFGTLSVLLAVGGTIESVRLALGHQPLFWPGRLYLLFVPLAGLIALLAMRATWPEHFKPRR